MSKPKTIRRVVTGHRADGGDAVCRLGMVFIDAEEPAELAALR
ncbi:MAG TPA: hypothetical protein VEL04_02255 [Burkholderiales bacterium]|nr:hypothetical protein [Burkholderiales bacterium]